MLEGYNRIHLLFKLKELLLISEDLKLQLQNTLKTCLIVLGSSGALVFKELKF